MTLSRKQRRNLAIGLAFVAPNIVGFMVFAMIPLFFSLVMAFTNWDLKLHNMFKDESIKFVGLDNFIRLMTHENFWRFLGNTLFLMMTIPFRIAGCLVLAILLTRNLRGGGRSVFLMMLFGAIMVACVAMLAVLGAGRSAMTVLLTGVGGGLLIFGVMGGSTFYRTMFYLPHFCAGVATFILWKKLYKPIDGPINNVLAGPLRGLGEAVNATPTAVVQSGLWVFLALVALLLWWGLTRLYRTWNDGDLGTGAAVAPLATLLLPVVLFFLWAPLPRYWIALAAVAGAALLWRGGQALRRRDFGCPTALGFGSAIVFAFFIMTMELILIGFGLVVHNLPALAGDADGLTPPLWIADYHWAKPSLMIMMLWGAIGSNNMLLYIAGLSNIPQDLYEAADIDGAGGFQRFWHVTWPQLAPTTFFIGVMATIHGLRAGFEIARTMTQGGPAGATTFLSYFIFTEGFDTGRLGYSSAIAWTLFAMTLCLTLLTWRFGNRYVND